MLQEALHQSFNTTLQKSSITSPTTLHSTMVTLLTTLAEIGMDDKSYTTWITFSSMYDTTPPLEVFLRYLKEQTLVLPDKLKHNTISNARPKGSGKVMTYHIRDEEVCGFCKTGPHTFYSSQDFRAQKVEQYCSIAQRLKSVPGHRPFREVVPQQEVMLQVDATTTLFCTRSAQLRATLRQHPLQLTLLMLEYTLLLME